MDILAIIAAAMAGVVAGAAAARYFQHDEAAARLGGQCAELEKQVKELKAALEQKQAELQRQMTANASIAAEKRTLDERVAAMEKQLTEQFQKLAAKIFDDNNAKSKESLQEMLKPMREDFGKFKETVAQSFGSHFQRQQTLQDEIGKIVLQADNLTKALKGDVKAQGNWGEVILERILEDAGLQKGRDYTVQGADMGLKHVEDGSLLKPDVIINLPDNKHIVIDSKVSLTHYERFCAEADEVQRAAALKLYLSSIRAHVSGLAARRYQDAGGLNTPECVLMFMPIEGAFSLAVQADPELHRDAWDKKVAIVCPTTLFVTLQTVASIWKREDQNRNVQKIAEVGGRLYDKIEGFVKDMQALHTHLNRASGSFDEAFRKLHVGPGNMLRQAEQMKQLGAKTSKSLPKELLEAPEDDVSALAEVS